MCYIGTGPVAKWFSSRALLQQPRVPQFRSWAPTWHHLSGHAEAASHIAQPEALTTRIYNYKPEVLGEKKKKKKEDWQQILAQVQIFKRIMCCVLPSPAPQG